MLVVNQLVGFGTVAGGLPPQGGVDFDGIDGYAGFTAASGIDSGNGPFSMLAWINADSYPSNAGIVEVGNLTMSLDSNGFLQCQMPGTAQMFGTSAVGTGAWVMVAITHAGGAMSAANSKIYVDGSDDSGTLGGSGTPTLSATGHIGRQTTTPRYFDGEIAQVALWDVALSAAAVGALYGGAAKSVDPRTDTGAYTVSANLLNYFPMNEGTGAVLDDLQQVANGALNGTYVWTTSGLNPA